MADTTLKMSPVIILQGVKDTFLINVWQKRAGGEGRGQAGHRGRERGMCFISVQSLEV